MEKCICNDMISCGDMSPRLWKCPQHDIQGFPYIIRMIDTHAKKMDIKVMEARKDAFEFLQEKVRWHKHRGKIYFCEDRFESDLRNYYRYLNADKPQPKHPSLIQRIKKYFKSYYADI